MGAALGSRDYVIDVGCHADTSGGSDLALPPVALEDGEAATFPVRREPLTGGTVAA